MTIGEYTQTHIHGEDGEPTAEAIIESNGRQIRPLTALLSHLVDEFRLHVTEDGIWTRHVDPANVGMAEIRAHAPAFDSYEPPTEDFEVGIFCDSLDTAVQDARKPHKDPVSLRINANRTLISIQREYPMGTIEWTDRLLNIDPAAVRKEQDPVATRALAEWQATLEVTALHDALSHIDRTSIDRIAFKEADGRLVATAVNTDKSGPLTADSDDGTSKPTESVIDFGDLAEPAEDGGESGAQSLYSLDYLVDQVKALKNGDIHETTLYWGDDVPCELSFEREDDDGDLAIEGALWLAPRIQDD